MRCKMAARYLISDKDTVRAQEEYYRYWHQIDQVDKSKMLPDRIGNVLCYDCGHTMTNRGDEEEAPKV